MKKLLLICLISFLGNPFLNAQITFQGCTSNALGAQNYILVVTGTTNDAGTIRNTYESNPTDFTQGCPAGVCEIQIKWNIGASRWEVQLDNDGPVGNPDYTTACLYYNTSPSFPNPPDLTLGSWLDCSGGLCPVGQLVTLTGDVQSTISSCTDPDIPTITATPSTICPGSSSTLTWTGNLNDATLWNIYTGSCGGTQIGTTATSSFVVTPGATTTYFVRGEGGCVTPGSCGTVSVTVNPLDNASFNYGAAAYCVNAADPTPTITGLAGGTFSSTAGLSINAGTGVIDLSVSTPGTYTVTYTTAGSCPNSSGVSVTVNALDDASFTYSAGSYCVNDSDPTPTITGLAGGTFSSTAGLSINAGTGVIDLSVSTPGTYTVTYTTAGSCPNSSGVSVTVNALDDASFTYSAGSYCVNDSDPTPTITGLAGGTFSSTAGLAINAGTGVIDLSVSTPGTYTVTYTTAGACPNSSNVSVTINALDDASFNYSAAAYCVNDSDPTPTITGLAGGTFSSTAGLSINAGTGVIDLSVSTPGTYTVTYTTTGSCPNSSNVSVTINALDDASFNYSASSYCLGDSDPTPTITGLAGGTFSSVPAGLNINATTGFINIGLSVPNSYTVTYTTAGSCPNSSNVAIAIGTPPTTPTVVSPMTVCPASNVILSATGSGTGSLIFYNNIPAPIGTVPMPPATGTFNAGALGAGSYTFGVTESNGVCQSLPATIIVTVGDVVPPTAVCQNITVFLDGAGNTTIVAADIDGGSTDNCAGLTLSASQTSFTCADIGTNNVTLTATDGSGNSANCVAVVTVADTTSPVASCQNITAFLDGSGNVTINAGDLDNGSSDNCGTITFAASQTSFTCADIGTNNVTLTVTDGSSNTATCTAVVTISDTVSPTAVCQNITVFLDGAGNTTITAGDLDGGSVDNCGAVTLSASQTAFTCADIGTNNVTLTVTDGSSNIASCTAVVTIADSTSPVAVCQNITVFLDGAGNTTITAGDLDGGSVDNCGAVTLSASQTAFTCADIGTNNVTLTVTDGSSNIASCTAVVTIADSTSPVAVCQNITVFLDGAGNATITSADLDGGSTDNCSGITFSASQTAFTCADLGTNNVTLTVTDGNGNSANCLAVVTVTDTVSPVASCQNITAFLDGSGNVTINAGDLDNGSSDNCTTISFGASQTSFTCADIGTNNVTLTVTDGSSNIATCAATVTVLDTVSPIASCQNITVFLDAAGNASIVAADIDGGSTDNCTTVTLSAAPTTFTCANVGTNNVTLTVTDGSSNIATCTAVVTVSDTVSPNAVCQDINVYLDGSGNATISAANVDGGSFATCGVLALSVSETAYSCANVSAGVTPLNDLVITGVYDGPLPGGTPKGVELYVIRDIADLSMYGIGSANNGGGTDGEEFTFPAVSVTAGSYIYVASEAVEFANYFGFAPDYTSGSMAINGDDAIELFYLGSVIDVFGDINVDGSGEVWDYLDGWAYRMDNTGTDGSAFTVSNWIYSGIDAMDGETSNATAVTPFPIGSYSILLPTPTQVTLYAEDGLGNIDSCIANLTVLDTIAPAVTCQDTVVELDAFGNGTLLVSQITASTSDNCGVASTMASTTDFTCGDVGLNSVTLTVTDNSGNASTCSANVLVFELVNPTASNATDTLVMCLGDVPAPDVAVITDAADDCGSVIVTYVGETTSGTACSDTIVRTYNVADMSGNNIDVTHTIVVSDTIAPTASNPLTLEVQCSGDVPAPTAGWVTDEADNCSSPTVAWVSDVSDGLSCPETITRTFSVTDGCGNFIEVEQLIIINDTEAPVLDATALTTEVGFCDVTPAAPTATDNCAGVIDGVADVTFPINTLGTTVVTWTFTDDCGNSVTQTQNVTIQQINVNTTFASDGITIVSSNNTPGVTYQWLDCNADTLMTGATNKNFTPTYSSDFAVIVTQDGCTDTSACVTITEVSIDELKFEAFTMYPNPTQTGMFTINLDAELKEVSVIDMLGRKVIVGTDLDAKTIDGSALMNGAYIVRITTQNDQQMVGTITVQQ